MLSVPGPRVKTAAGAEAEAEAISDVQTDIAFYCLLLLADLLVRTGWRGGAAAVVAAAVAAAKDPHYVEACSSVCVCRVVVRGRRSSPHLVYSTA